MKNQTESKNRLIISNDAGLSPKLLQDSLMLIKQKNVSEKAVNAKCTLITEETGVRIIIRDTGNIDNIVDSDSVLSSFRQYYLTRHATSIEESSYLTTTGYNRNEYFVTRLRPLLPSSRQHTDL